MILGQIFLVAEDLLQGSGRAQGEPGLKSSGSPSASSTTQGRRACGGQVHPHLSRSPTASTPSSERGGGFVDKVTKGRKPQRRAAFGDQADSALQETLLVYPLMILSFEQTCFPPPNPQQASTCSVYQRPIWSATSPAFLFQW